MRDQTNSPKLKYLKGLLDVEHESFNFSKNCANKINPNMSITFVEGRILQLLIKSIQAKKVIEVGAFTGYSALWIAKALNNNGKLWTLEQDPKHAAFAREALSGFKNCEVLQGDALSSLKKLENESPFDAIFIDADKGSYLDYLEWAKKHIRKGGLIIGDNSYLFENVYLDSPTEYVTKKAFVTMREFNKTLCDPTKFTTAILPTEEGMTVSIKEF